MAKFGTLWILLCFTATIAVAVQNSDTSLEAGLSLVESELKGNKEGERWGVEEEEERGGEEDEMAEMMDDPGSGSGEEGLLLPEEDEEWMVDSTYMCSADFIHNTEVITSGSTARVKFNSFDTNTEFKCFLDDKLVEDQCFSPLVLRKVSKGEHWLRILPIGCDETEPAHGREVVFSLT